jgi:hypothetical protein
MSTLDNLHNWCRANGISVSLCQDSQRSAKDMLDELLTVGNSAAVYSGDSLKIIPYDEVSAVGNGAVYTAPTASGPIADLTDKDFATDREGKKLPLKFTRKKRTDCDNVMSVEHIDRSLDYSHNTTSECDQKSVAMYGPRKGGVLDAADLGVNNPSGSKALLSIHSAEVAQKISSILAKRGAAGVNRYEFTLNAAAMGYEAMDLVTITDTTLGINQVPVRFVSVKETADRTYECVADQFIYGLNHPDIKDTTAATGTLTNVNVDPGLVNPPIIFEPTREMLGVPDGSQIWFLVSGADPNYGGCIPVVSVDGGVSYSSPLGNIGPATTGELLSDFPLASDPDTTNNLDVDLSESGGELSTETQEIADGFADPCYVNALSSPTTKAYEVVCPTVATLTAAEQYSMTTYIRRAVTGTPKLDHPTGSRFGVIDSATFKIDLPLQWIGITLYFKFMAYNKIGQQQNKLEDCVAYPYTPNGVPVDQGFLINGHGPVAGDLLSSLTAHNTSAYSAYNKANFPTNFTGTTWVDQSGTTASVDSTKTDDSYNPITPAHVSNVDVHTLLPAAPTTPFYVHITPWFGKSGHVPIGVNCNSTQWVAAFVEDAVRRGFNGVSIDWYGQNSFENQVTLKIQSYLASRPANAFKFFICADKGIPNLSQATLISEINYINSQYFGDANYVKVSSKPLLQFFGIADVLGDSAMSAVKAGTATAFWQFFQSSLITKSYCDGCFDWTHNFLTGVNMSDPYNLTAVDAYYTAINAHPTKPCFGSVCPGFNGYLTRSVGWSKGKMLPRASGACWIARASEANSKYTSQIVGIMVPTWNDWEEGSDIEGGIENDITVTASRLTTHLNWSASGGTGDESTIDHYEVIASNDDWAVLNSWSVAVGVGTFDLTTAGLTAGTPYTFRVRAVGKACIRDHVSNVLSYTP